MAWGPKFAVVVLYLLVAFSFIAYPRLTVEPWLDPSYEEAYAYFLKTGAQAGVDYAFTYGPLGHFIIPRFDPNLFYLDCAVIVLLGLLSAVPLAVWGARHGNVLAMLALAAIVACLVPGTAGPEIGYLIAVVAMTQLLLHSPNAPPVAYGVSAAVFAFLALTKFTLLVVNSAAVGAIALHLGLTRRYGILGVLLGCYAGFLGGFWLAAGQHPLHFVAYLVRSLQVSDAYNAGMYLPGRGIEVVLGVILWTLLLIHLYVRRRSTHAESLNAWLPLLFMLFVMLITWKMGIVRQQGHINKFYVTMATLPFFLPYPPAPSWRKAAAFRILPVLIVVLGSSGYFLAKSTSPTGQLVRTSNRLVNVVKQTFSLGGLYDARMERMKIYHRLYALPEIRAIVGDATVDIFSANQGTVVFNGFNYHPRPVFQGYQACTPELIRWNGAFYSGSDAPQYVLYIPALTPIDNRYPTSEDPETLKAIFRNYHPVHFERGMYLLERRQAPVLVPPVEPGPALNARTGDWIEVPDAGEHWQYLELHLSPTPAGRLRAMAYKPPLIEMIVRFADGTEQPFRVNIGSVETGFILNPCFGVLTSIEQWPLGEDSRQVAAFSIRTQPEGHWGLHDQYTYRLSASPPLAPAAQF